MENTAPVKSGIKHLVYFADLPSARPDGRKARNKTSQGGGNDSTGKNVESRSGAGHRRAICRNGRAVAAADARRDPPGTSISDLAPFDAPARRWTYGEFHERVGALAAGLNARGVKPGEFMSDPSGQLRRGDARLVRLRRTRRHCGDHQHPLGAGGNGIFRRPLRRGGRDHAASLCRNDLGALPQPALDRGDFARCGCRARAGPQAPRGDSFEALFADSADRPRRATDPLAPCSVQYTSGTTSRPKAVLWTHANALWGAKVNAAHQDLHARRRASDLSAAVPHQRAGLFDAGEPVGRRNLRDPATVFRQPFLERRRGAWLHLDLDDPVLHESAAGARNSRSAIHSGSGAPRCASRRHFPHSASRSSAGGA